MKKIAMAYVPVLHEGYRRFFAEKRATVQMWCILGDELVSEFTHLKKEIRRLQPEMIHSALCAWYPEQNIIVLGANEVPYIQKSEATLILPDEDVSRGVAEKHFHNHQVIFESVYLRRDRIASLKKEPVVSDSIISSEEFDQTMIGRAEEEGKKSSDWLRQIGALVVRNGEIVVVAYNHHVPSPHTPYVFGDPRDNFSKGVHIELSSSLHAEAAVVAIAASRKDLHLSGADLYVPTFPCPLCANTLTHTGIRRLFYRDGYTALEGANTLRSFGIEIVKVIFPEEKKAP